MSQVFQQVLKKAENKESLTKEDIKILLSATGDEAQSLYRLANSVRKQWVGDQVHLRGIIEFSNFCRQHCQYCGLRADNKALQRYRLTKEQILEAARHAVDNGYKTLVLQGGEDVQITNQDIADIVVEIKKMDIAVTLSFGEHPYEVYKLWREAGADRYLLKHETADPALYEKIRPGKTLESRLQCQSWLKELGYQLGSGCMIGLPGQTIDTLAADLLLFKEMDIEMCGMGPFIPHPDTPLAHGEQGSVEMTLNMLAVARILMPQVLLPATTSLATIHPHGRELSLQVGANVIMPNVGPQDMREFYAIYPNKLCTHDHIGDHREMLVTQIESLGRTVAQDQGHSPNYNLK